MSRSRRLLAYAAALLAAIPALGGRARQASVREMCTLSTRCTLLVAEHSAHRIPEEEPVAVVDAIARAVDAAHAHSPAP